MSGFLKFACDAARGILLHALCARTACGEALRAIASLSLKQNFGFEILKQGLKFISALAFFGRNSFFKIYVRFKFKDDLQKRSCLTSLAAAITAVQASPSAILPTTLPALAALPVSTRAQSSALVQMQATVRASTPPSEQIRARARAKFKSTKFKSVIFKFVASQSTLAKRTIFKFTKFTIFSRRALKFKNILAARRCVPQRRALV